jgi:hypothetical protein
MSKAEQDQKAADMAACIARVFLGDDDGKRCLAYLRERFGADRRAFIKDNGRYDAIAAALRDGQSGVMSEIEAALKTASPAKWAESLVK